MIKIAITGNRQITVSDISVIREVAMSVVSLNTVDVIYTGGAVGVDTFFLKFCLEFRKKLNHPKQILVVPNTINHQPELVRNILKQADEIIELGLTITKNDGWSAYQKRNEYMVDHSDKVIAFWDGRKPSGTYNCIQYAKKSNKPIKIFDIEGCK